MKWVGEMVKQAVVRHREAERERRQKGEQDYIGQITTRSHNSERRGDKEPTDEAIREAGWIECELSHLGSTYEPVRWKD